jgi:hypothetical protein
MSPASNVQFELSSGFYWAVRMVNAAAPVFVQLGQLESALLRDRIAGQSVDRPVYICGLPRAGTTISVQMLSEHPHVATHRYSDFVMPYLPYSWNRLFPKLPIQTLRTPVERVHRDRLQITRDSAEGIEEMLWEHFFPHLSDAHQSHVLDAGCSHPAFEHFYADHIRKLLLVRGRSRYVAKCNPNVTRLRYLQSLFPDARFLLYVRHPVHHIASLMKQTHLWERLSRDAPRQVTAIRLTGHLQIGPGYQPVHTGDAAMTREIERCCVAGQAVKARALEWAAVYGFVLDQLRDDPSLAAATRVVRFEDLCQKTEETLDGIVGHVGLSASFEPIRAKYAGTLSLPDYYRPNFTMHELRDIASITATVATRLGYEVTQAAATEAEREAPGMRMDRLSQA